MTVAEILVYAAFSATAVVAGALLVRFGWRAAGAYRVFRAGPRPLRARTHTIWRDPGDVAALDLVNGPGGPDGAPTPPFRFLEEHTTGSQPCVSALDARGRRWRIKWGSEVRAENFAVRLVWACGYHAEVTYFLSSGTIAGAANLARARPCLDEHGGFTDARFELDDPAVRKFFEEHSWAWNDNPFVGTRELNGLKVLVMLLSDWDTKDRRDVARGSNTAIFEHRIRHRHREARYLITDWGGSMGRWGSNVVTRGRWDPDGFEMQTPEFVLDRQGDVVRFGYTGQRTADVNAGITIDDIRWLNRYLGRITDAQLREALDASGATEDETERFARAIRARITQLERAL